MSRRKDSIRKSFALTMHKEGLANRPAPSTPVIANPSDEPGPSHSAFSRAEAIAAKQLKIVRIYPPRICVWKVENPPGFRHTQ